MAEIVDYRIEKTLDELEVLIEFGLLTKNEAREIVSKRRDFEYILRRKTNIKLETLKYIRFELNLLESIEKYKKTKLANISDLEEIDRKIFVLQTKKLNELVRSRSAHISTLFRKVCHKYQFDENLWLAYIEFAKKRRWNSRVSALYWRFLRVASNNEELWIKAASHEVGVNKSYDVARGLFLKALRHHQKSPRIWSEYFRMELKYMSVVDQRARIIFKVTSKSDDNQTDANDQQEEEDIWEDSQKEKTPEEKIPEEKPAVEENNIISGHLPIVVYGHACTALDTTYKFSTFLISVMTFIYKFDDDKAVGLCKIKEHILKDINEKHESGDERISKSLISACQSHSALEEFARESDQNCKKLKTHKPSKLDTLYECYQTNGIEATRSLFKSLEKSVTNQTLSLFVGMIQVESWEFKKDSSKEQINRIREIYDKSLRKFGKTKPKLWYEYLQFEHNHLKELQDFDRINQLFCRAQMTLEPSKVGKVIEKYTLIRNKSCDVEYSDYSDLED